MEEQNKVVEEAIAELRNADEAELKKVIEQWFERTRNDGLHIGARFISAAIAGAIDKHLKKGKNASLRDYKRMTDDIIKIISVQLKQESTIQNDLETSEDVE